MLASVICIFISRIKSSLGIGSRSISITFFSCGDKSINNDICLLSSFSCSKPRASSTSSAQVTGVAPWRISLFVPFEFKENTEPGTAKTSLLYSVASLAVISVPDLSSASIISTAFEIPAIRRLRIGKLQYVALKSGSNSESRHPSFLKTSSIKGMFVFGCIASVESPEPGKTIVLSPTCIAFL